MLEYLLNYDIDADNDSQDLDFELDITDHTILQEQINTVRKSYFNLIKLYDKIQSEYMKAKTALSSKNQKYYLDYSSRAERLDAIAKDQSITNLQEKIEATKEAIKTIENQLAFIKSDLRLLGNSMYNK